MLKIKNDSVLISRQYSFIPGFQEKAKDIFILFKRKNQISIHFCSIGFSETIHEQGIITGVEFEEISNFCLFLLENACRASVWQNSVLDFCTKSQGSFKQNEVCELGEERCQNFSDS